MSNVKLRLRHNKKRNTAFLYETLVRELTKAVIAQDTKKKKVIVKVIKENFHPRSTLAKQLDLYKAIYETENVDLHTADKLLFEVRRSNYAIDQKRLFTEQSKLIAEMNKNLSKRVFNNFVPNYKALATIYQLFNNSGLNTRQRVVLEENLVHGMLGDNSDSLQEESVGDGVVFTSFVKRFNSEYVELLDEQKELLNNFIVSFSDGGVGFKLYLNEEVGRLKAVIKKSLFLKEILDDEKMKDKTNEVLSKLDSYAKVEITNDTIAEVMKIQALAKEITD